jgi:signal transduction histidine kinase/CheY-like chemotaxis protein
MEKLRQIDAWFTSTVDSAPINIARYSHDLRLLYVNPALAMGCPRPASEMLGRYAADIWGPGVADPLKLHSARALATGQRQTYELEMEHPGRKRVIKQWTLVPLPGPEGDMPQILVMSHDVTAQRQVVDSLRESDRRKSEFIAVLSHELRNPLAAIRTSLYVVEHARDSEEGKQSVRVIDRQVEQLARMVDDLLDVTRITQNKVQLQRRRIDINDVVRQTLEDNRSALERSGVRLVAEIAPRPLHVNADGVRIAQVVTNLLGNAVKFTPSGGLVKVSVSLDAAAEMAVLRVTDTGTGIDPALLGRLFEPFMQADRTLDRTGGGLGLGLALVKGLIDLHEGDVRAHSDGLGKGAEFTVRLPLATTDADRAVGARDDDLARTRRRVLIIEDDGDVATGLKAALQIDGHDVTLARSGVDALALARATRPDVVLCDIGLPVMNGYDVARAFRADAALRSIFLVALSGYAQAEDIARAHDAGFDEHLAKPPTIDRLKRIFAAGARPATTD